MALEVGHRRAAGAARRRSSPRSTKAGGGEYGKTNVAMAPIADERLGALARVVHAKKVTPARSRAGRSRHRARRCSGTSPRSTRCSSSSTASRPGADPDGDLENLKLELLVADRDHVERRLERVEKQAKSGDPKLRARSTSCARSRYIDAGGRSPTIRASWRRARAVTTKPLIAVENGPGGIDLALEAELAELTDEEAAAFRDGGSSALEEVVRRLRDALDLVTFFTAGEKETRAWPLRNGETALDAADTIHPTSPAASSAAR
jgi:hypothetical protein